jgi:hypothetical protein
MAGAAWVLRAVGRAGRGAVRGGSARGGRGRGDASTGRWCGGLPAQPGSSVRAEAALSRTPAAPSPGSSPRWRGGGGPRRPLAPGRGRLAAPAWRWWARRAGGEADAGGGAVARWRRWRGGGGVERRASSVERRASEVERRASEVERRASSVEPRPNRTRPSLERRVSSVAIRNRTRVSLERRGSSVAICNRTRVSLERRVSSVAAGAAATG